MRKLNETEEKVLRMIFAVGGSYCPDDYSSLHPARSRVLRDLVKKHRLVVVETDVGPRFNLAYGWDE
jgi:hypothetical protein